MTLACCHSRRSQPSLSFAGSINDGPTNHRSFCPAHPRIIPEQNTRVRTRTAKDAGETTSPIITSSGAKSRPLASNLASRPFAARSLRSGLRPPVGMTRRAFPAVDVGAPCLCLHEHGGLRKRTWLRKCSHGTRPCCLPDGSPLPLRKQASSRYSKRERTRISGTFPRARCLDSCLRRNDRVVAGGSVKRTGCVTIGILARFRLLGHRF